MFFLLIPRFSFLLPSETHGAPGVWVVRNTYTTPRRSTRLQPLSLEFCRLSSGPAPRVLISYLVQLGSTDRMVAGKRTVSASRSSSSLVLLIRVARHSNFFWPPLSRGHRNLSSSGMGLAHTLGFLPAFDGLQYSLDKQLAVS